MKFSKIITALVLVTMMFIQVFISNVAIAQNLEVSSNLEANPSQFNDLLGHWAEEPIMALKKNGIIAGYETNDGYLIKPQEKITRAEYLTVLLKLRPSLELIPNRVKEYKDVKESDWFKKTIDIASSNGIVEGYIDGTFKPNNPITRAEIAAIMTRFNNWSENDVDSKISSFSDVDEKDWFYLPIMICRSKGIINGYPEGTFKPQKFALRGEAFSLLANYAGKMNLIQYLATADREIKMPDGIIPAIPVKEESEKLKPLVENKEITIVNIGINFVEIKWNKANNQKTSEIFEYAVFYSEKDNIKTIEEIIANGTIVDDYKKDIDLKRIGGLKSDTTYYFNIIVRDQSDNKIAYQVAKSNTRSIVSSGTASSGGSTGGGSGSGSGGSGGEKVQEYTITFESNGGSSVESQKVLEDRKVKEPEEPSKEGYGFKGWYLDEELTHKYDFETVVKENKTLYAKWGEVTYKIVFESNGGSAVETQELEYGKKGFKPEEPAKEGHKFKGWFGDEELTQEYDFESVVKENKTVYAKWEINKFSVAFESNGGSEVETQIINYNEKVVKPEEPTKEGYGFKGWYEDEELTQEYDFESLVKENKTLYSKWGVITYKIVFESNGGSAVETQELEYGKKAVKPQEPTKEGHEFKGWFGDEELTQEYDFESEVKENKTVFAKWEINKFSVTFESNGGSVVETQEVEYGKKAVKPEEPTKEGYGFKGWFGDEELTQEYDFESEVKENKTVFAKWEVNKFCVTFESNGGSAVETQELEFGKKVIKPQEPTKEGHEFKGWFSDEELTQEYDFESEVRENKTVYAKWEKAEIKQIELTNEVFNTLGLGIFSGTLIGEDDFTGFEVLFKDSSKEYRVEVDKNGNFEVTSFGIGFFDQLKGYEYWVINPQGEVVLTGKK